MRTQRLNRWLLAVLLALGASAYVHAAYAIPCRAGDAPGTLGCECAIMGDDGLCAGDDNDPPTEPPTEPPGDPEPPTEPPTEPPGDPEPPAEPPGQCGAGWAPANKCSNCYNKCDAESDGGLRNCKNDQRCMQQCSQKVRACKSACMMSLTQCISGCKGKLPCVRKCNQRNEQCVKRCPTCKNCNTYDRCLRQHKKTIQNCQQQRQRCDRAAAKSSNPCEALLACRNQYKGCIASFLNCLGCDLKPIEDAWKRCNQGCLDSCGATPGRGGASGGGGRGLNFSGGR